MNLLTQQALSAKLQTGEDSFTQFKRQIDSELQLAEEMVAFANTDGGYILIGIGEDSNGQGMVVGVDNLKKLNNQISNASSEHCVPSVFPKMETLLVDEKRVVVLFIEKGIQQPYRTKSGKYLMRSGADKRAVSQEEMSRMLQSSGSFHIEELPIREANIETTLDKTSFYFFFEKLFDVSLVQHMETEKQSLAQVLNNMNVAHNEELNLVGLLLFGRQPQRFRPSFILKAVGFYGNDIADTRYLSSEDISGTLDVQFKNGMNFLKSNLLKMQRGQGFNSLGELEISEIALEEFLVNALIHRDYNKLGSVQLLVFQDRVEIINPGHLVNHLTIENIKSGNAIPRNPILLSYASKILPYRGLGSGIRRALVAHPNTQLINEKDAQQFKVIMWR